MSYKDGVIFQRTESGNAEIHKGKLLLRHNERLVLVLIDGVNTYADMRGKLRSLLRDKFDRALDGLQEKGLVTEILFPLIDQQKDAIDPKVLVDFLKSNSRIQPDTKIDLLDLGMDAAPAGAPALGMISCNGNAGLSVDTRAGFSSQMRVPDYVGGEGVDLDLPLDLSLPDMALNPRVKTKLVNVYPNPASKRRKKPRRAVVTQISWHIYVYYGLLAAGVLLVLYSFFLR